MATTSKIEKAHRKVGPFFVPKNRSGGQHYRPSITAQEKEGIKVPWFRKPPELSQVEEMDIEYYMSYRYAEYFTQFGHFKCLTIKVPSTAGSQVVLHSERCKVPLEMYLDV